MWIISSVIVVAALVLVLLVSLFASPNPNNRTGPSIGGATGAVPYSADSDPARGP